MIVCGSPINNSCLLHVFRNGEAITLLWSPNWQSQPAVCLIRKPKLGSSPQPLPLKFKMEKAKNSQPSVLV